MLLYEPGAYRDRAGQDGGFLLAGTLHDYLRAAGVDLGAHDLTATHGDYLALLTAAVGATYASERPDYSTQHRSTQH